MILSTPIQRVAHFERDCHESFDRSVIIEVVYGKKRKKSTVQSMPFYYIF